MEPLTVVVAVLAVLIAIWLCRGQILTAQGTIHLQNGFEGGADDVALHLLPKLDESHFKELTALGFRPLGIYWETMPGKRRFLEYVFVQDGENCFGIIYPTDQIMPRRASFLTVFPTGGVVFTKNNFGGLAVQEGNFIAGSVGETPEDAEGEVDLSIRVPLTHVLERHRENVNRLVFRGEIAPARFDTYGFLEAQRLFHVHPVLRRRFSKIEQVNLLTQVAAFAIVPGVLAWHLGFTHLAVWLALLAEGIVGLVFRYGFSSAAKIEIISRLGGSTTLPVERPERDRDGSS